MIKYSAYTIEVMYGCSILRMINLFWSESMTLKMTEFLGINVCKMQSNKKNHLKYQIYTRFTSRSYVCLACLGMPISVNPFIVYTK